MAPGPVEYAERELGVHDVYTLAQNALDTYVKAGESIAALRHDKRSAEDDLALEEARVASEVMDTHRDASQAARDRILKTELAQDPEVSRLRGRVRMLIDLIDEQDVLRSSARQASEVHTARMHELAGYLQYLAAAKLSRMEKAARSANEAESA